MTRQEAIQLAEELHEYRASSCVEGGRSLSVWVKAREDRLDVLLRRADEMLGLARIGQASLNDLENALELLIAEVRV